MPTKLPDAITKSPYYRDEINSQLQAEKYLTDHPNAKLILYKKNNYIIRKKATHLHHFHRALHHAVRNFESYYARFKNSDPEQRFGIRALVRISTPETATEQYRIVVLPLIQNDSNPQKTHSTYSYFTVTHHQDQSSRLILEFSSLEELITKLLQRTQPNHASHFTFRSKSELLGKIRSENPESPLLKQDAPCIKCTIV